MLMMNEKRNSVWKPLSCLLLIISLCMPISTMGGGTPGFPPLPSKRRVACVAFTCLTSVYAVIYLGVVIIRLHPQIGSE